MKIGILTFHSAHNYGAVIQCYGLQQYLASLGHQVYVIDYRPRYFDIYNPKQRKEKQVIKKGKNNEKDHLQKGIRHTDRYTDQEVHLRYLRRSCRLRGDLVPDSRWSLLPVCERRRNVPLSW